METSTPTQEGPPLAEPQKQHEWLERLVGEWTCEGETPAAPGEAPHKVSGTESVRAVGRLWIQAEGKVQGPDGNPGTTVMTLGYDPQKQKFVGTWIGSMMTYLWVYEGDLSEDERTLSLFADGPDCLGDGKLETYKDQIEFIDNDHRTLTSFRVDESGEWKPFMVTHYYRVK